MTEQLPVTDEHKPEDSKQRIAAQSNSFNMILLFAGIVVLGIAIIVAWNKGYLTRGGGASAPASAVSNIVYLDVGGIISAATKKYLDSSKKPGHGDPSASGKEFSKNFSALLDEYKEAGVIVIDKRYVVTAPDGHDITREVAAKLELALD